MKFNCSNKVQNWYWLILITSFHYLRISLPLHYLKNSIFNVEISIQLFHRPENWFLFVFNVMTSILPIVVANGCCLGFSHSVVSWNPSRARHLFVCTKFHFIYTKPPSSLTVTQLMQLTFSFLLKNFPTELWGKFLKIITKK